MSDGTWMWQPFVVGADYVSNPPPDDADVFAGVVTVDETTPDGARGGEVIASVVEDRNGALIAAAPEMARLLLSWYERPGEFTTLPELEAMRALLIKAGVLSKS